jgi:hypothetical protein
MAEKKEAISQPIQSSLPKQNPLPSSNSLETPRKSTLEGLENNIQSLANTVSKLIERIDRNDKAREISRSRDEEILNENFENKGNWIKDTRRSSMYGETYRPPPASMYQLPAYTKITPDYSYIKLPYLRLDAAIEFTEQIRIYQAMHGIRLPVPTLVTGSARNLIMSDPDYYMTLQQYLALDHNDLLDRIQKLVRPKSKADFLIALRRRVPLLLPPGYKPDPANFRILYAAYLDYKTKWWTRYLYMSTDNKHNIPECHDKDGGLINLFLAGLDQIPYPRCKYRDMSHDLKKLFKGPDGFELFLDNLYDEFKKDYDRSLTARELASSINLKVEDSMYSPKEVTPIPKSNSLHKDRKPFPTYRVTAIEQYDEIPVDDESYFMKEMQEDCDQDEFTLADTPVNVVVDDTDVNLHALMSGESEKPNCCFAMLFFNACTKKEKCNYKHDPETMLKGFHYYANKLRNSNVKPKDYVIGSFHASSNKPSTPIRVQGRPPPGNAPRLTNLSEDQLPVEMKE